MPLQFSNLGVTALHNSAHAGVATWGADDYGCVYHQGRAGGAVMPGFVCILHVPAQAAGASVETEQVRVIRFDVDELSPYRDTAAFVCRRAIQQAGAHRALVLPQNAPG